jgi:tRNA(Ile)-lysidine synthase
LKNKFTHTLKAISGPIILAASGGRDSTVLASLCKEAGLNFKLAHCNFQLRGGESDRDEKFVRALGKKYGVELFVKKFDTEEFAGKNRLSIQEAARKQRYEWFNELAEKEDATIFTAHHRDDSIETLLMNFFRGTGLAGLTGIPERNGRIFRPLLSLSGEELAAYAKEKKLEWVEDSSNASSKYTRNYFRNELIPSLEKIFPEVRTNLAGNIERFSEISGLYLYAVGLIRTKMMKRKGNEWQIPVKQLLQFNNRALVYEIIRAYGFVEKQVDELIRLGNSDSGRYISSPSGEWRVIRHRHWFIFSPKAGEGQENFVIDEEATTVHFAGKKLEIKKVPFKEINADAALAFVEPGLLRFPLLLRRKKKGDYFYPFGMKKKKKLSRFFIDQKLSASEKENVWVIENEDGRIIWVLGLRIDERFRVKGEEAVRFRVA